jgi:hypothetical protein
MCSDPFTDGGDRFRAEISSVESLKHHDEHADMQITRPSTSAVQLPPPGDWKIGASPSMDEFLIRKLQALSTEIERCKRIERDSSGKDTSASKPIEGIYECLNP